MAVTPVLVDPYLLAPVPVSETDCGDVNASSVNVRVAMRVPIASGRKTITPS